MLLFKNLLLYLHYKRKIFPILTILALTRFANVFCFADDTKFCCSGNFDLPKSHQFWALYDQEKNFSFHKMKIYFLHLSTNDEVDLILVGIQLCSTDCTSDMSINDVDNSKWDCHLRGELAKARHTFNLLRYSVPVNSSSFVKFLLY